MLEYTGHPIVDVGIATIVAFANKDSPQELVDEDFENIADYMERNYTVDPLRSFLTVAFPNSGFTQPAYFNAPDKQQIYAKKVLRSFRSDTLTLEQPGVFLGLPIVALSLDVKDQLSPGHVFRQHVPLLTGENVINFYPYGDAGLPISGLALLAIQAFPLGSAKCAGRFLAVHSDDAEIMRYFTGKFLEGNLRSIELARAANSKKMPEPVFKYRTLLVDTLLEARVMQLENIQDDRPFSITAYHFSNSGQGPDLAIYHLPSQVILYLKDMLSAEYVAAWKQVVHRAWELPKLKRGQDAAPPDFKPSRNWLYEDLFSVAINVARSAPGFIRTYFLRDAFRFASKDPTDPRQSYSLQQETNLVSWKLVQPFLRRIMNMESERIENIRSLGDELANYVRSQNDRRFFRAFYTENRYDYLRNALIKANTEYVKRGNPPFLTLDTYISVFEEGEELARVDWRLARDLTLIRMVEQLYANGWLGTNQDAIPERTEESDKEE